MAELKEIGLSIDLEELSKQFEEEQKLLEIQQSTVPVRSSKFSLGSDPRIRVKAKLTVPDFYSIELLKDRQRNIYTNLKWRVVRDEIDSGDVVAFNVYRRKLADTESVSFMKNLMLSMGAVEALAVGNQRTGDFSEEKKSLNYINATSLPAEAINKNLTDEALESKGTVNPEPDYSTNFEKISTISCSKFLSDQKKKSVFVQDRNYVEMNFQDKTVGLFETFEYYIETVCKNVGDSQKSSSIVVSVENSAEVRPPKSLFYKQITPVQIAVTILIEPSDNVENVYVFRCAEDEVVFKFFRNLVAENNKAVFYDSEMQYGKFYKYRVFLENIHGHISQPGEITAVSTAQSIISMSRSNNLKIPVFTAVQDQNSSNIKILIYPNDSRIAYYELKRRDQTIYDSSFRTPSSYETGFGAVGWITNTFFVQKTIQDVTGDGFNKKLDLKEIVFIDDTVSEGHYYQYRIRGYDLAGNPSPYAFFAIRATNKRNVRTPINVRMQIDRIFPLRIRILWDDENVVNSSNNQALLSTNLQGLSSNQIQNILSSANVGMSYRIERRKFGQSIYESFPITRNRFLVDEVPTMDLVLASQGTLTKPTAVNLTPVDQGKLDVALRKADTDMENFVRRSYGMPPFLKYNSTYFYKITAISQNREESNPTSEFMVSTVSPTASPINFVVQVLTTQVKPIIAKCSWQSEQNKLSPDRWVVERKFDTANDSFSVIGYAYLDMNFFDRDLQPYKSYVYRVTALDIDGRRSSSVEARLTL